MTISSRILKGAAALAVLAVLSLIVWNWYGDFKSAPKNSAETSTTVEPSSTPSSDKKGSGGGSVGQAQPSQPAGSQPTAIVTLIDGVNFRPKPDATAKAVRGLNKGEVLTLISKQGDWYHVTTSDGADGYVTANPQYTAVQK